MSMELDLVSCFPWLKPWGCGPLFATLVEIMNVPNGAGWQDCFSVLANGALLDMPIAVVCLNQHISNEFTRVTGRKHGIYVIPNGIDISPPCQANPCENHLRVTSGRYILAVGRLVPEKNFHLLLSAFLAAELPIDVKLVLVGDVDYDGKYGRSLLYACASSDRVIAPGAVFGSQLSWLYHNAGLFVLPSSHEGMSFALLTASVAGIKIIASNILGNSVVCRDFARLVPVGSVVALREAIELEWN